MLQLRAPTCCNGQRSWVGISVTDHGRRTGVHCSCSLLPQKGWKVWSVPRTVVEQHDADVCACRAAQSLIFTCFTRRVGRWTRQPEPLRKAPCNQPERWSTSIDDDAGVQAP
jgi:hypothetical protein